MADNELEKLEQRINELVALCKQLREENRSLQRKQEQMNNERAQLIQRNELVRARVEAMVTRLKSMEQNI